MIYFYHFSLAVLETEVVSEEESSSEDGGDESEQAEVGKVSTKLQLSYRSS